MLPSSARRRAGSVLVDWFLSPPETSPSIRLPLYENTDANIALKNILKLQLVQNCLVRVLTRSHRFSHSVFPLLKGNIASRTCSVAAPILWNSVPVGVKSIGNITTFRSILRNPPANCLQLQLLID